MVLSERPKPSGTSDGKDDLNEDILRAFTEWLAKDASSGKRGLNRNDEPSPDARAPDRDAPLRAPNRTSAIAAAPYAAGRTGNKPSVVRRIARVLAFGLIVVAVAETAMAWQSSGGDIHGTLRTLRASLASLSADVRDHLPNSTRDVFSRLSVGHAAQAVPPSQATPDQTAAAAQQPGALATIETVTGQLGELRGMIERLISEQERMGEQIAELKAEQDSINQRLASLPAPGRAPAVAPHTKLPKPPPAAAAARAPAGHVPAPLPGSPTPLR